MLKEAPDFTIPDIGVSAFSDDGVKAAAYTRIQEEIKPLEDKILQWKGLHNALSIVSRLPLEILSTIFKSIAEGHVIDSEFESEFDMPKDLRGPHWIRITHVCSLWRHIALECPTLWTRISPEYPQLAFEMLKRSKSAPLTVIVNLVDLKTSDDFMSLSMKELFRIRNLCLSNTGHPDHIFEQKALACLNSAGVAPILEHLDVSFTSTIPGKILPKSLLGGSDNLRSLALMNCDLHWDSPFLRTLTSLKINTTARIRSLTVFELISALANLANLEILSLASVLYPSPKDIVTVPPARVAQLPRLATLDFQTGTRGCALFLAGLAYPNTTVVKINSRFPHLPEYNVPTAPIEDLARVLLSKNIGPIRCLMITEAILQAWTQPAHELVLMPGSLILRVETPQRSRPIWEGLQLQDVESLFVRNVQLEKSEWLHLFGKLKHLKYLHVTGCPSFIQAFSKGITSIPGMLGAGRLNFQALRLLEIMNLDFSAYHGTETCHERLHRALLERRKRGMALRELRVYECDHIYSDEIRELERIVQRVKWDGHSHEGSVTSEDSEEHGIT